MNPTKSRQGRGGRSTNRQRHSSRTRSRGRFNNGRSRRRGGGRRTSSSYRGGGGRGGGRRGGGRKMPTFDPTQFINTNPAILSEEKYTPTHSFDTFGLDERLVRTIVQMGFTAPTPIQDQIIPYVLEGRDVIGLAETGTGKTAAFLVPLIEKRIQDRTCQTLILAPTRELAIQIEKELRQLTRGLNMFSVVCVGGTSIYPQIKALRHKNDFIIGTPGRIMDLIDRKNLTIVGVTTVVLDEADRMLDMGFIHDMRKILSGIPRKHETLFFSATMPDTIKKLVHDFLHNPVTVSVKKRDVVGSIEQDVVRYQHDKKYETLLSLLVQPEYKRVLIFGSMKHSVEKLSRKIAKDGVRAESIHGNKSHSQRQRSLGKFKKGEAQVLVATDVAARGIHVDDVTHVINYDLPNTRDDYIHRIGRTGRATKKGKALTFISK